MRLLSIRLVLPVHLYCHIWIGICRILYYNRIWMVWRGLLTGRGQLFSQRVEGVFIVCAISGVDGRLCLMVFSLAKDLRFQVSIVIWFCMKTYLGERNLAVLLVGEAN